MGLAIIISGLAGYGLLYHRLSGKVRFPQSLLTGALAGAALYGFDYHLLPKTLRPGFERVRGQVQLGGAGMPAFEGKLTAAQIRDVAAFVATRAGRG